MNSKYSHFFDRVTREFKWASSKPGDRISHLYANIANAYETSVVEACAYNAHYLAIRELRDEFEAQPASDAREEAISALIYLENQLLLRTRLPVRDPLTDSRKEKATKVLALTAQDLLSYEKGARKASTATRLGLKNYPRMTGLFADFERSLDLVMPPIDEAGRALSRASLIVTVGSCFAQNISGFLHAQGYSVINLASAEEASPLTLCRMAEALAANHGDLAKSAQRIRQHPEVCLIFTAGVGEMVHFKDGSSQATAVLKNRPVLVRSIESVKYVAPQDIAVSLGRALEVFKMINSNSRMICTVSPVPLETSFNRAASIVTANSLSKAALLLGVQQACDTYSDLSYFPSYEIVKDWAPLAGIAPFGADDGHPRHVSRNLVAIICLAFIKRFFGDEEYARALSKTGASSLEQMRRAVAKN